MFAACILMLHTVHIRLETHNYMLHKHLYHSNSYTCRCQQNTDPYRVIAFSFYSQPWTRKMIRYRLVERAAK